MRLSIGGSSIGQGAYLYRLASTSDLGGISGRSIEPERCETSACVPSKNFGAVSQKHRCRRDAVHHTFMKITLSGFLKRSLIGILEWFVSSYCLRILANSAPSLSLPSTFSSASFKGVLPASMQRWRNSRVRSEVLGELVLILAVATASPWLSLRPGIKYPIREKFLLVCCFGIGEGSGELRWPFSPGCCLVRN